MRAGLVAALALVAPGAAASGDSHEGGCSGSGMEASESLCRAVAPDDGTMVLAEVMKFSDYQATLDILEVLRTAPGDVAPSAPFTMELEDLTGYWRGCAANEGGTGYALGDLVGTRWYVPYPDAWALPAGVPLFCLEFQCVAGIQTSREVEFPAEDVERAARAEDCLAEMEQAPGCACGVSARPRGGASAGFAAAILASAFARARLRRRRGRDRTPRPVRVTSSRTAP